MRHRKSGRKLGRNSSHRKAMFRNMVTSLMLHGRIQTTEPKAKELRRLADRIISLGKRIPPSALENLQGDELVAARAQRVHAIRHARRFLTDREAVNRVFGEYSERYQNRPGGYTRILKIGYRAGDNARMALIELVEGPVGVSDVAAETDDGEAPEMSPEQSVVPTPDEAQQAPAEG